VLEDDCYAKVLHLVPDQGANIIDVGANIGMFAVWLGSKKPGSTVLCLEPMPPTFDVLSKNIAKMKASTSTVKPVPMGLASPEAVGKVTFTNFEDVPSCSTFNEGDKFECNIKPLYAPAAFVPYYRKSWPRVAALVESLPLQSFRALATRAAIAYLWRYSRVDVNLGTLDDAYGMAELDPPAKVDLLKVDVEGLEMGVLRSIPDGWWSKIQNCIVEVHDIDGRLEEMKAFLVERGFKVKVAADDAYNDEFGFNHYMLTGQK